jgi:hypothetical protein
MVPTLELTFVWFAIIAGLAFVAWATWDSPAYERVGVAIMSFLIVAIFVGLIFTGCLTSYRQTETVVGKVTKAQNSLIVSVGDKDYQFKELPFYNSYTNGQTTNFVRRINYNFWKYEMSDSLDNK